MTQNKTKQILEKNRKIAETGIFLALFLGLAYAFSYIPNLEYITAIAFLSGLLLGWKRGIFVAIIGEGIFSIANPFGSSLAFPTLLAAQLISFTIFALVGAASRLYIPRLVSSKPAMAAVMLGITGLLLTLLYNVLTTVFYAIPSGFTMEQTLASIISGIPFYLINMIANTITFSVLITLIIRYVNKHYPHYFQES
ncbi:MAG: hypothetical protein KAT14_01475 [Candidatus Marinimicrobia bacterium]|nr:hypothetical protein [Candidatus Neomarinimicrobiota bacterium]